MLALSIVTIILYGRYRGHPDLGLTKFGPKVAVMGYSIIVYALNLLPYIAIKRSCFIYHYMPALMYAQICCGFLFDLWVPVHWRASAFKVAFTAIFAVYLFYAPWVYALPLTNEGHERRRWLPRWN